MKRIKAGGIITEAKKGLTPDELSRKTELSKPTLWRMETKNVGYFYNFLDVAESCGGKIIFEDKKGKQQQIIK